MKYTKQDGAAIPHIHKFHRHIQIELIDEQMHIFTIPHIHKFHRRIQIELIDEEMHIFQKQEALRKETPTKNLTRKCARKHTHASVTL